MYYDRQINIGNMSKKFNLPLFLIGSFLSTLTLKLSMREDINPVDRPEKVEVTITSNKNRYGIIKNIWTEGEKTDRIEYIP